MKALLKRALPDIAVAKLRKLKASLPIGYWRRSYAQEGEDLILARLFAQKPTGFYVDVGAHHPQRFSNTYFFYRQGWRGVNIEPNPAAVKLFRRSRPRDINVACGVAKHEGQLNYYMFNDPALNSFDRPLSEQRQSSVYRIVATRQIAVKPLASILASVLPEGTHIDFMSVDAEGYDLEILESNDWSRFRPTCLLVEAENFDLGHPSSEPVDQFLTRQCYRVFAKTYNTLFYLAEGERPG